MLSLINRGQRTTPTFGTYTYRGSGLLAAKCMSANMLSLINRGQKTTPTFGISTYRRSCLLAANCTGISRSYSYALFSPFAVLKRSRLRVWFAEKKISFC